jgi:predicted RNA-binding Zn-ribbon protein involved in translation (DUF1610 family)
MSNDPSPVPDPADWTRQANPAARPQRCPQCGHDTTHAPYLPVRRNIGDKYVRWFCEQCGSNNGIF